MKRKIIVASVIMYVLSCGSKKDNIHKGLIAAPIGNKEFAKVDVLPFAHSQDDDLKGDFENAFERYQDELDFTSVILTAQRWAEKKDYNGRPIYRERLAAITAARNNKCYIQHFSFRQDFEGESYQESSYVHEEYGWKEFDCKLE